MLHWVNKLSIRAKIWGGFALVLAVLVSVAVSTMFNLGVTQSRVKVVVKDIQPLVIASMELLDQLNEATSFLGFYLLSHEEQHKKEYQRRLGRIKEAMDSFKELAQKSEETDTLELLGSVEADIEKFMQYETRLLPLAENLVANFPGSAYAAENINPLSQSLLQALSEMNDYELSLKVSSKRRPLSTAITEMRYNWANVMVGIRGYLAFRDQISLDNTKLFLEQSEVLVGRIEEQSELFSFEEEDSFARVRENFDGVKDNFEALIRIQGGENWRADAFIIRSELGPLVASVGKQLARISAKQRQSIESTSNKLLGQVQGTIALVVVLVLIGLAVGVLVVFVSGSQTLKPIMRLHGILKNISQGEGDLTQRANLASEDEVGEMSGYFNTMMENLQSMIREVTEVSNNVRDMAGRIDEEIDHLSRNTNQAADRSSNTATAAEEMNATIAEIARNARDAADQAEEARDQAVQGEVAVNDMSNKMQTMGSQINGLKQDVGALSEKGKGMLNMVSIINEIANQTNLLALNAAIEAARAGDSGRGFAVVADEVRQLAEKTQESTAKIASQLNDNMSANQRLTEVMDSVSAASESMVTGVAETADVIRAMAERVKQMHDLLTHIATASDQQTAATAEISNHVEIISTMGNENNERVGRAAQHTTQLITLAEQLDILVNRFKV